jgi:hypothetical protein
MALHERRLSHRELPTHSIAEEISENPPAQSHSLHGLPLESRFTPHTHTASFLRSAFPVNAKRTSWSHHFIQRGPKSNTWTARAGAQRGLARHRVRWDQHAVRRPDTSRPTRPTQEEEFITRVTGEASTTRCRMAPAQTNPRRREGAWQGGGGPWEGSGGIGRALPGPGMAREGSGGPCQGSAGPVRAWQGPPSPWEGFGGALGGLGRALQGLGASVMALGGLGTAREGPPRAWRGLASPGMAREGPPRPLRQHSCVREVADRHMEVNDDAASPQRANEARPARVPAPGPGRAFAISSGSPSLSDSDDGVRGRRRVRSRSRSAGGGRGPPPGLDDMEAHGYSAGGDDSDEIAILGDSTNRSHSPYDPAIHTMEEVDVPNSSAVHGEPALGGGVGVGSWGPPTEGEGMELDSVTDIAGAGDGAWSGVGGLGSGQVRLVAAGAGAVLSAADGASARPGAGHDEAMHIVCGIDRASDVAVRCLLLITRLVPSPSRAPTIWTWATPLPPGRSWSLPQPWVLPVAQARPEYGFGDPRAGSAADVQHTYAPSHAAY